MAACFVCKIDGGKRCDGSCGLCGASCPGFDTNCREVGCVGQYRNYGRTSKDFLTACDTCRAEFI